MRIKLLDIQLKLNQSCMINGESLTPPVLIFDLCGSDIILGRFVFN